MDCFSVRTFINTGRCGAKIIQTLQTSGSAVRMVFNREPGGAKFIQYLQISGSVVRMVFNKEPGEAKFIQSTFRIFNIDRECSQKLKVLFGIFNIFAK